MWLGKNVRALAVGLAVSILLLTAAAQIGLATQNWYNGYYYGKVHKLTLNLSKDNITYVTIAATSHTYNVTIITWKDQPYIVAVFHIEEDANYYALSMLTDGEDPLESALQSFESDLEAGGYSVTIDSKFWVGPGRTMLLIYGYDESATATGTLWQYTPEEITHIYALIRLKDTSSTDGQNGCLNLTDTTTGETLASVHTSGTETGTLDANKSFSGTDSIKAHFSSYANAYIKHYAWGAIFTDSDITWDTYPDEVYVKPCYSWTEFEDLRAGGSTGGSTSEDWEISLSVSPTLATWGSEVTLTAKVTTDSSTVAGKTVSFYRKSGTSWISIGAKQTNSEGKATIKYTLPSGSSFGAVTFKAEIVGENKYDTATIAVKPPITQDESWWAPILELFAIDDSGLGLFQLAALTITILGAIGVVIKVIRKYALILLAIGLLLLLLGYI